MGEVPLHFVTEKQGYFIHPPMEPPLSLSSSLFTSNRMERNQPANYAPFALGGDRAPLQLL